MSTRIRLMGGRIFLLLFSIAISYLIFENVFFRFLLMTTPLNKTLALHEGVRALAQSSKNGVVPKNYLALAGDSYAQGFGNWFLSVDWNKNPDFSSAHLIHNRTGRDVVSFGSGGAGSLKGIVTAPVTQYMFLKSSYLFNITPPDTFFVYFYEGNDLNNNLEDVKKRFVKKHGYDVNKVYNKKYFDAFIDQVAVKKSKLSKSSVSPSLIDSFLLADFIWNLLRGKGDKISDEELLRREEERLVQSNDDSKNLINGLSISL